MLINTTDNNVGEIALAELSEGASASIKEIAGMGFKENS